MGINIWTIKYKKNYGDEWENGIMIGSSRDINKDGSVILDKYFALKPDKFGGIELIPFRFEDMFDIGYIDLTNFSIGSD